MLWRLDSKALDHSAKPCRLNRSNTPVYLPMRKSTAAASVPHAKSKVGNVCERGYGCARKTFQAQGWTFGRCGRKSGTMRLFTSYRNVVGGLQTSCAPTVANIRARRLPYP